MAYMGSGYNPALLEGKYKQQREMERLNQQGQMNVGRQTGEYGLKNTSLQNEGQFGVQAMRNQGALDQGRQTGEYGLKNTALSGEYGLKNTALDGANKFALGTQQGEYGLKNIAAQGTNSIADIGARANAQNQLDWNKDQYNKIDYSGVTSPYRSMANPWKKPEGPRPLAGFANSGIIPGKMNPNVADDVTINAKKGEMVLSVDDVKNLGGPERIMQALMELRKQNGQPMQMGPKGHNQPDGYGRMDKPGLRKGIAGGADGFYANLKEGLAASANAMPYRLMTGDEVLSTIDRLRGAAPIAEYGNENEKQMTDSLRASRNELSRTGGPARGIVDAVSTSVVPAVQAISRAASGYSDPGPIATPQKTVNEYSLPADEARRNGNAIASAPMDFTAANKQAKLGAVQRPQDRVAYDPTADNASRLAAEQAMEAMYAKQSAETDARRIAGYQQQQQDRLTSLRSQADAIAAPRQMTGLDKYNMSFVGKADMSNPSYRAAMTEQAAYAGNETGRQQNLAAINNQIASMTGQRQHDQSNSATIAGQKIGMQERQMQDATTRRGQDFSQSNFSDTLGLKKEELNMDKQLKQAQLAEHKRMAEIAGIPYEAVMAAKPSERLQMWSKLFHKGDAKSTAEADKYMYGEMSAYRKGLLEGTYEHGQDPVMEAYLTKTGGMPKPKAVSK